jgi:hypothetical protein
MTYIFLFSFHELVTSFLTERAPFWLATVFCVSALILLKKLTAMEFITTVLTALTFSFLLAKLSMPESYGVILHVLGMHLPTFTLFSLVAPIFTLTLVVFETLARKAIVNKYTAILMIFLLVTFNIDVLLRAYNISLIRAQAYGTNIEAVSYLVGKATALVAVFSLLPLMTGALQQWLSPFLGRILIWSTLVTGLLLSLWLNYLYLNRIVFHSMLFFE